MPTHLSVSSALILCFVCNPETSKLDDYQNLQMGYFAVVGIKEGQSSLENQKKKVKALAESGIDNENIEPARKIIHNAKKAIAYNFSLQN